MESNTIENAMQSNDGLDNADNLSVNSETSINGLNKTSIVGSVASNDNGSITSNTTNKTKTKKVNLDLCTTLIFINARTGARTEKILPLRVMSYSELQKEIARLTPKSKAMYVIQNEQKERITPENFIPMSRVVVREVLTKPPIDSMAVFKKLKYDWEETEFHDARYQRELEEQREAEEDEEFDVEAAFNFF